MELVFAILTTFVLLMAIGVGAITNGADSRPGIPDDHTR